MAVTLSSPKNLSFYVISDNNNPGAHVGYAHNSCARVANVRTANNNLPERGMAWDEVLHKLDIDDPPVGLRPQSV